MVLVLFGDIVVLLMYVISIIYNLKEKLEL